ncbi:uncharacterized protein [Chelonus insularis]|uniref:uncharacterized protein n=1 Tax=Chelonus insularis TaxID=460826 RepID=UPI00158C32C8|nr:uncharacterized protein LOC118072591 [Chelonus insularis]
MKNIKKFILFKAMLCYLLIELTVQAARIPQVRKKINEKCQRDRECLDENAFCDSRDMCHCEDYYFHTADLSSCHAAAGLLCESNDDCNTMANGECGSEKKCTCKKDYILDNKNSSNCFMKPTRDNDFCQETQHCVETIGSAICINNKCKCYGSHRFVNETGKCILSKGLYHSCQHNYECYDGKESKPLYCINGECAFLPEEKNVPDEGTCFISSPTTIGLSLILFIYSLHH